MWSVAHVSQLIDQIYGAAETGDGWDGCLATICRDLGATGSHLLSWAPSGVTVPVAYAGTDPAAIDAYRAHFHRVDPWVSKVPIASVAIGRVLPGQAAVLHTDIKKTEFYADFGRAMGITRALFGVAAEDIDGSRTALSINRDDSALEFDEEATAYVSALLPHLGRALQVQARLGQAAHLEHAAFDALDRLPMGVILVDGSARICHANAPAARMLRDEDGIATDGARRIGAATVAVTRRLRDLCAEVADSRSAVPRHSGGVLNLPRAGTSMPLQVLVAPVPSPGPLVSTREDVAAVLFITDPSEASQPDHAVLRAAYGLTPAESRVAALFATGQDVNRVADELNYTRETVRWYAKQLLSKTDCRSRSELVARLTSSIAVLRSV